jgi:hypothetical protein
MRVQSAGVSKGLIAERYEQLIKTRVQLAKLRPSRWPPITDGPDEDYDYDRRDLVAWADKMASRVGELQEYLRKLTIDPLQLAAVVKGAAEARASASRLWSDMDDITRPEIADGDPEYEVHMPSIELAAERAMSTWGISMRQSDDSIVALIRTIEAEERRLVAALHRIDRVILEED